MRETAITRTAGLFNRRESMFWEGFHAERQARQKDAKRRANHERYLRRKASSEFHKSPDIQSGPIQ